jgi:hypothetical protein
MRIRVLTGLAVWLLCGLGLAQTTATPLLADRVVVLKKERTLQLVSHGRMIKAYKVALGGDPIGPKTRQGDHKTPEGIYVLDFRNAHSQFYKAIHISYPAAGIAWQREKRECRRAVTFLCTDCQTGLAMWARPTASRTGRTAALL